MSNHVIPGPRLSAKKWRALKLIGLSAPRYAHVSCEARMVPAPNNTFQPLCTSNRWRRDHGQPVAIALGLKGVTFNAGRNKVKRERKAARAKAVQ